MTWKVPVLGAVVLAGSGLVVLTGSALVRSTRSVEEEEAKVSGATDAAAAKLDVRGMTCGSCATTARIALERIEGIHDAEVSLESGSATVRYDLALTQPARFIPEFERLTGYEATVVDDRPAPSSDGSDAAPSSAATSTAAAPHPAPTGDER